MNNFEDVLWILFLLSIFIVFMAYTIKMLIRTLRTDPLRSKFDIKHLGEESYQKYAKFYGNTIPTDKEYNEKLNSIYKLITESKMSDIKEIAKNSNCTLEECVLKIKYLKNKRLLGDYYVDTKNFKLLPCSVEDQKLLDKYRPYIYASHLQVDEISNYVANKGYKSILDLRDEVFNDLVYLDKKGLLNGIKIDDIDRRIIYYTIEKRKINSNYETVHCPNCGAINDVSVTGKVRCGYCNTIIKGNRYEEEVEVL